jgi:protein TonB
VNARLAGALAASVALHAALVAGIGSPFGVRWGQLPWFQPGTPIRAELRGVADRPAAPAPASRPEPAPAAPAPERAANVRPAAPERSALAAPQARSLLPQPHYYLTRELDVQPGIMTRVEPEYPQAAAERHLSGKVVLRLFISEAGEVERLAVLRAEPPGVFEGSAERAFSVARFTPGMKDGRAVRVQMTLEVSFDSAPPPEER